LRRDEARTRRINSVGNHCVLSVKYNPRGPNTRQIIKKHRSIIENDERAKEILPTNFIRVSYKRNAYLKELLAPSNPYKERVVNESIGCFKCAAKRCDCCRNILVVGTSFSSIKTKKIYKISKGPYRPDAIWQRDANFQFSMTFNFNIFQCFSNIRNHLSNFSYLVCISCKIFIR
jgi:hypothetical protein